MGCFLCCQNDARNIQPHGCSEMNLAFGCGWGGLEPEGLCDVVLLHRLKALQPWPAAVSLPGRRCLALTARGRETTRKGQVCSLCDECWLCVCSFLAASSCSYSQEVAQIESANLGQPCCGELGPDAGGSLGIWFGAFEACAAGLSGVLILHVTRDWRPLRCREPEVRFYWRVPHRWWPHFGHALRLVFKGLGSEKDPGYWYSLTLPESSPESPRTLLLYICSAYVGGWWEVSRLLVAWS